jgi:predicted RNA methylase
MDHFFPIVAGVNMDSLQISKVGKYSVSKPADASEINRIIAKYFTHPETLVITDATANNGGNTIRFALGFYKVSAIEIDLEQFNVLTNNVRVYGLTNVDIYHRDYLTVMATLKQDVIFIDAPWGGMGYKTLSHIDLFLGKRNMVSVVVDIVRNKLCKLCVLKVPSNYNFAHLFSKLTHTKIDVYPIYKFVIVCIDITYTPS